MFLSVFILLNMIGAIITFDDLDWNSNQYVDSIFVVNDFRYMGDKHFYTNYGYDLDVYSNSLFYIFEDEDIFEVTNNSLFIFESVAAYQVSEVSLDTLIVEGWKGVEKKYSSSFLNITEWQVLLLNYYNIDRVVFRLGKTEYIGLTDFNFDNFSFKRAVPEMVGSVNIKKVR